MTSGENQVLWDRIDPNTCERLIAVLLSRLHPATRRIDGAGGDGGRDVVFATPEGEEVYEIKSFTGRLTSSRRAQIKRSLERVATTKPAAWRLVVPIQFTDREEEWFQQLVLDRGFPCEWLGLDWLDGELADHRDLRDYFVGGTSDRVLELLRDFEREQAGLAGGLADASDRIRRLARQIDELNPYFRYSLSVTEDQVSIAAAPKYEGALDDAPFSIRTSFEFDDTPAGREAAAALREALDYGVPTTVAGGYLSGIEFEGEMLPGLLPTTPGELTIGAAQSDPPDFGSAAIQAFQGQVVASLPLQVRAHRRGLRGGELDLSDWSGCLTLTARFDPVLSNSRVNISFKMLDELLPAHLLPVLRLMAAVSGGARLDLLLDGKLACSGVVDGHEGWRITAENLAFLSDVALLQEHTGVYFLLPEDWSDAELADLHSAVRLIRGETLEVSTESITVTFDRAHAERVLEAMEHPPDNPLVLEHDLSVELAGHTGRLGLVRQVFEAGGASVLPVDDASPMVQVKFDLAGDRMVKTTLVNTPLV